jgi:hypothetical protein
MMDQRRDDLRQNDLRQREFQRGVPAGRLQRRRRFAMVRVTSSLWAPGRFVSLRVKATLSSEQIASGAVLVAIATRLRAFASRFSFHPFRLTGCY